MTDNKSAKAEVITPAQTPAVPPLADDRSVYLYSIPAEDAKFVLRKATGKTAAERPLMFEPSAEAERFTLTAGQARTWLAESDPEARAALLAGLTNTTTSSIIRPDAGLWAEARGLIAEVHGDEDKSALRALLTSGFLLIPAKVRKDRAAGAKVDTTDAVLDELFG